MLRLCVALAIALSVYSQSHAFAQPPAMSTPALRPQAAPSDRPLGQGPAKFVDANRGDDAGAGTLDTPWRTLGAAVGRLKPGDTLYLRGGVYYESVYVALRGTPEAPITVRSYPNELATIHAGLPEFQQKPAEAWVPVEGTTDEFRSARPYPNLREVIGSFGDSLIGLQTYYHPQDLRATGELVDWENWDDTNNTDVKPLYCGPGVWYDHVTGFIHARLAQTHLPDPLPNYRGPTDPRQVPLAIASFRSVAMYLDGAKHIKLQDLQLLGAGYTTMVLDQVDGLECDRVKIWAGTYGIHAAGTRNFKLLRSALHGNAAPWTFRSDTSKRDYPGRPHRNITRLNTHALLEISNGLESSVYATPQNDHWEIANCELTDAHDGVYFGGINCQFHHNLLENMQDDGIYLSPMYLRHKLDKTDAQLHVYQNVFRQLLTGVAFGGTEANTSDQVYIYRNVFDLRRMVLTGRPTVRKPEPSTTTGHLMGDHGSPPWPAMNIYHNTIVAAEPNRDASMAALGSVRAGNPRRVFNNLFYHFARLPGFVLTPVADVEVVSDGNLYWSPAADQKTIDTFFNKFRASPGFAESKKYYPDGSAAHSLIADPLLVKASPDPAVENDYRPTKQSPLVDAGVELPAGWPDPLRKLDGGKPDIGALPLQSPGGAVVQ